MFGHIVRRVDGRTAGVDVGEVPGSQRAGVQTPPWHSITRRRPEVGPSELLGPRPAHADGPPGRLGQSGRLDGRLGAVLAAEPTAHVRHDDPDLLGGQAEQPSQFALRAIGTVATRPHGQLAVVPFGHGRTRLHRHVLDVGQLVGCTERLGRSAKPVSIDPRVWAGPPSDLGVFFR